MIYFSHFGVAAPTVLITVQDFTTGTSTALQNFTTTALQGMTPKGSLLFANNQTVADGANASAGAQFNVFSVTGSGSTSGSGCFSMNRDNLAAVATRRYQWQASATQTVNNASSGFSHQSGTLDNITDGISIDYVNSSSDDRMFFVSFAGSGVSAKASNRTLGTGTSPITTPSAGNLGFDPDVVIFSGIGYQSDNSLDATAGAYCIGFADRNGVQMCAFGTDTGTAADSIPLQAILTNRCAGMVVATTGAKEYDVTAGGFASSVFTLTPSANAGSDVLHYHALAFGGRRWKIAALSTPTSTGNTAITGVGFTPQFALVVLTNLEATDPTFPITSDNKMTNLSICAVGNEQWVAAMRIDQNAATTNTLSQIKNTAIWTMDGAGAAIISASLTSFDSDGMTLNYSAVAANAKKGFILFIE